MSINVFEMKVKITFTDELLGTMPGDKEVFKNFVAGKADTINEEAENIRIDVDNELEKGTTVFPKNAVGVPFIYDYQLRGYFKEACKGLKDAGLGKSGKVKNYKKKIDLGIFVKDRENLIDVNGDIGICERPLRAQTMQGERVALSRSESVPAGSTVIFTVQCLNKEDLELVEEWLDYGRFHGTGQWRNSGRGRFTWELLLD